MSADEKKVEKSPDSKLRKLLSESALKILVHQAGYHQLSVSEVLDETPNLIPLINVVSQAYLLTFRESIQGKSNEALGEIVSYLEAFSGKKWDQWWTIKNEMLNDEVLFEKSTLEGVLLLQSLLPQKDLISCLKQIEDCSRLLPLMKVAVILGLEIPEVWGTVKGRSNEALNAMILRIEKYASLDSDTWSSSPPIEKEFFMRLISMVSIRKDLIKNFLDDLPSDQKTQTEAMTTVNNMNLTPDSQPLEERKEENLSQVVDGAVKRGMLSPPRQESPPDMYSFQMGELMEESSENQETRLDS